MLLWWANEFGFFCKQNEKNINLMRHFVFVLFSLKCVLVFDALKPNQSFFLLTKGIILTFLHILTFPIVSECACEWVGSTSSSQIISCDLAMGHKMIWLGRDVKAQIVSVSSYYNGQSLGIIPNMDCKKNWKPLTGCCQRKVWETLGIVKFPPNSYPTLNNIRKVIRE